MIGLGVFDSSQNQAIETCLNALRSGYRLIDTAEMYKNESEVGRAIAECGLPREDIFVSSKVYFPPKTAASTREKLLECIEKVGGPDGYADMMLMHNANIGPVAREMLWKEMEALHVERRIKNIGVSNHGIQHLEHLKEFATIWPPAVNQLELHPWLQQREIVDYCRRHGIVLEAYCPLVRNRKADDSLLKKIAQKHDKTTAQILVRYCLQKGWVPLPKSDNPLRIKQNIDVFGWELDLYDMESLDNVPQEPALVIAVDNNDRNFIWNPKGHVN